MISDAVQESKAPLPANLPHIAYILLWYPLFTQPFIFKEVQALRNFMPLQTYALYGQNLRYCSDEMKKEATSGNHLGMKATLPIAGRILREFIKQPIKILRLFRKHCLRPWPSLEVFGENLWAFCAGVYLGRQFKEDGIDFIYSPWPRGAATAASVAGSLAGIPYAVAVRGDNLEPADPDLGDKLEEACFARANNLADKKRIENFDNGQAKGKTELLYNNLSLNISENEPLPKRFSGPKLKILALGRFDVTKGFDVLLHACAILKQKGIPFELTLAGGGGRIMGLGKMEKELAALRKKLDLEEEVSMPGLINHDELPALIRQHDLFAAPCVIHKSGKRDGIPNTIVEAMLYGMPVIGTTVNALPEIIIDQETGLAIPPEDPEALANAIIWMKENPDAAIRMGQNASSLVKKMFDPSHNANAMKEILVNHYNFWKASGKCVA